MYETLTGQNLLTKQLNIYCYSNKTYPQQTQPMNTLTMDMTRIIYKSLFN